MLNRVASFSLLVGLSACAPSAVDDGQTPGATEALSRKPTAVQMNDVSVLYPLAKTAADIAHAYLQPSTVGENGPLLPEKIFDAVNAAITGINAAPAYGDLHAVAFRLDPCFAQIGPITDPASCDHQLRIVFQDIGATGTTANPAVVGDSGYHAFYSLSADEFDTAVKEVVALRIANSTGADLGALAVHPIMAKQGLDGAMAKGLNAFLLKHAGASNLTRLTGFLGVFAQHTSWNFAAVDVVNGKAKASPIAALEPSTLVETIGLQTAPVGLIQISFPANTTSDDVSPLLSNSVTDATVDVRQEALDSALRIENPGFHSPNTIDCVSCHTAEIARSVVAEGFFKMLEPGDANAFAYDPHFLTKTDVKTTYPAKTPDGLSLNLHAFSWDGKQPMIIQRVINETAAIVEQLNAPK